MPEFLKRLAKAQGIDWDNPPPAEQDHMCGCVEVDGVKTRGKSGWHWRYIDFDREAFTRLDSIDTEPYESYWEVYERCPAYWIAHGRQVDPFDRMKLAETGKSGSREGRKVKA